MLHRLEYYDSTIGTFRKCFQEWNAAIPNYYTEAREDDNTIMAKQREDLKVIEVGLGKGPYLYILIQLRRGETIELKRPFMVLRLNSDEY